MMLLVGPLLREGSRARLLVGSCVAPSLPVFSTDESETGEDAAVLLLGCGRPRARPRMDTLAGITIKFRFKVEIMAMAMDLYLNCSLEPPASRTHCSAKKMPPSSR
ncbi:hypothetical protein QYE76_005083 [Lolium multiflorum]|uniref:Uncharacterized protein n=1 Tax=Lolium multiflorum TaxID=4521 RepID=A0AAD8W2T3_LOLMU|nr:hypothetical protein QYE76_005083 [Lolium multiflorum]